MDEIHAQMHYEFVVACIAILLAVRTVVVTMLASTAYNLRRIPDSTYRLDFHVKRACLRAMIYSNDTTCFNQIRMYRSTFDRLCHMLDTIGGLKPTTHMLVDEQVAMFLNILAHDHKNRVIQFEFSRSGETISRYFNAVLRGVLKLQSHLLKSLQRIQGLSNGERWRHFQVIVISNKCL